MMTETLIDGAEMTIDGIEGMTTTGTNIQVAGAIVMVHTHLTSLSFINILISFMLI